MKANLYLTGFMASGKSSVGRELAALLKRRFVDLDDLVEKRLAMPISQAFARLGEEAFRRAETAELKKLARKNMLVVATGGGLPMRAENRELMASSGRILYLEAGLEHCRSNLAPGEAAVRPLWQDQAKLEKLYAERLPVYEQCDHKLPVDGLDIAQAALALAARLMPESSSLVSLENEQRLLISTFDGPQALCQFSQGRRAAILTERRVAGLHLERYQKALPQAKVITLPPGERSKTLASATKVYEALLEARLERGDLLVALGGGVITDLGAFAASTYKRGMEFVLASTSLLGCVDAAVGGKAAVNLGAHKNQIGCFSKPAGVILDLRALGTLPRPQRVEGVVEAYKTGLVAEPDLARFISDNMKPILAGDLLFMSRAARDSARAKAQVVGQDFSETGLRRILNLGHTYGHALEGLSRFRISHGRAVAAGLMTAAALSRQRGLLPGREADAIIRVMAPLAPKPQTWPTAREAWPLMQNDKKNRGGRVMFILLKGTGHPLWVEDLTPDELAGALAGLGVA